MSREAGPRLSTRALLDRATGNRGWLRDTLPHALFIDPFMGTDIQRRRVRCFETVSFFQPQNTNRSGSLPNGRQRVAGAAPCPRIPYENTAIHEIEDVTQSRV